MTDCEICRNHELCRLENKDKIKNCFYVYPTKEYLASKTEEYKLGYNKAIDDFANLMKEAMEHDWSTTKICDQIIYSNLYDKCNEIAEQLKAGVNND